MPSLLSLLAAPAPARTPGRPAAWVGIAARPGSGVGFIPAALSVQPAATLATLAAATLAAAAHRTIRQFARRA
jgi:hypothetical protein